jgi:hypothetical protein
VFVIGGIASLLLVLLHTPFTQLVHTPLTHVKVLVVEYWPGIGDGGLPVLLQIPLLQVVVKHSPLIH